jgi:hypothetical protein
LADVVLLLEPAAPPELDVLDDPASPEEPADVLVVDVEASFVVVELLALSLLSASRVDPNVPAERLSVL